MNGEVHGAMNGEVHSAPHCPRVRTGELEPSLSTRPVSQAPPRAAPRVRAEGLERELADADPREFRRADIPSVLHMLAVSKVKRGERQAARRERAKERSVCAKRA